MSPARLARWAATALYGRCRSLARSSPSFARSLARSVDLSLDLSIPLLQVVLTSSGETVLHTLALANPTAQVIASGATKLQALAGDGSTTLVLLLAELLRQAEAWVSAGTAPSSKHRRLLQFRRALMHLKHEQLEPLLLPLFRVHVVSVRTSDTMQLLLLAQGVVRTVVAPTLGPAAPVEALVELLMESILVPWCEAADAAHAAAEAGAVGAARERVHGPRRRPRRPQEARAPRAGC